jgi:hypothetical protein
MNVPARRTGSAAQRLASAGRAPAPAGIAKVDEFDCVVMPATVTASARTVDYLVGNAITSLVAALEPVRCTA